MVCGFRIFVFSVVPDVLPGFDISSVVSWCMVCGFRIFFFWFPVLCGFDISSVVS